MADPIVQRLRLELEEATPDVWPRVVRSVTARRTAAELLAALNRPPSPAGRLGWELRLRVAKSLALRRAA
jgi:hypothetical protein